MTIFSNRILGAIAIGMIAADSLRAVPVAPFTSGNILITRNSIFSSGTDFLYEYTTGGALVQTVPIGRPDGAQLRVGDVVHNSHGQIHLVQSPSYISTFDPGTQLWTHSAASVDVSNGSDLDLSLLGDYVYQRQIRMEVSSGAIATLNPASPGTYSETSVGLDGVLYSLNAGSIRWDVQRSDPYSLQLIGPTIRLHDANGGTLDGRGITASRDGEIFVAEWDGTVYKYDANGTYLSKLSTGANNLLGIDLRSDGLIMASSRFGDVIFTDTSFSTLWKFNVGSENALNEDIYAGFIGLPIPESSTMVLLATGLLLATSASRTSRLPIRQ